MTERYIADSAVFIMGDSDIDPSLMITVPGVADEMKSKEARLRFDLAREGGLRIEMPDPAFLEKVLKEAAATRDNDVLSETDAKVLAKALEYKESAVLLTDDFAVQNVAVRLGISVRPAEQEMIRDRIIWQVRCTGCGRYFTDGDFCPVCGSPMKRKMKHKKPVRKGTGAGETPASGEKSCRQLFRDRAAGADDVAGPDDPEDDFDYGSCLISRKSLRKEGRDRNDPAGSARSDKD
ncbi:NOB1 family endonuclease [Methanosarcinaceae archaeon]|nr:NOB1 family endonuclease [Methanosarcinaceae archaeon]